MKHLLAIPAAFVIWALFHVHQTENSVQGENCHACDEAEGSRSSRGLIICHFSKDLSEMKANLSIEISRCPDGASVVECSWSSANNEVRYRSLKPGYVLSSLTGRTVVIRIPAWTRKPLEAYCYIMMDTKDTLYHKYCQLEFEGSMSAGGEPVPATTCCPRAESSTCQSDSGTLVLSGIILFFVVIHLVISLWRVCCSLAQDCVSSDARDAVRRLCSCRCCCCTRGQEEQRQQSAQEPTDEETSCIYNQE